MPLAECESQGSDLNRSELSKEDTVTISHCSIHDQNSGHQKSGRKGMPGMRVPCQWPFAHGVCVAVPWDAQHTTGKEGGKKVVALQRFKP